MARFIPGIYALINERGRTAMDISAEDHKSIVGFTFNGGTKQQWRFEQFGQGYSICNVSTGLYLTLEAGIGDNVPVVASPYTATWAVEVDDMAGGNILIGWPNTSFVLDLTISGRRAPNTPIHLHTKRIPRELCQFWILQSVFKPGVYTLINERGGTAVDISTADRKSIVGFTFNGGTQQQWRFEPFGQGYSICNVSTGRYITSEAGIGESAPVVASLFRTTWAVGLSENDGGTIWIGWPNTPFVLDLTNYGQRTPGTPIHLHTKRVPREFCQFWTLQSVFEPGVYVLINERGGTVIDISAADHKSIVGSTFTGGTQQQWRFEQLGQGYSICSVSTGLYITSEAGIGDNIAVVASPFPSSWVVGVDGNHDGNIWISWPNTSLVLDLTNRGQSTSGTPIHLHDKRSPREPCQFWRFRPV